MKYCKNILITLFILFTCVRLDAQVKDKYDFYFNKQELHTGKALIKINDLCSDDYGTLWITTNRGIYWYDGHEFEFIDNNSQFITGLTESSYHLIENIGQGEMMLCSQSGSVFIFDYKEQKFSKLNFEQKNKEKIKKLGRYWDGRYFIHADNKLYLYNQESQVFEPSDVISSIYANNNSTILTKKDLLLLHYKNNQKSLLLPTELSNTPLINAFLEQDTLYLCTANRGIWKYSMMEDIFSQHSPSIRGVTEIKKDADNNFWMSLGKQGVAMFSQAKKLTYIQQKFGFKGSLSSNNINSIHIDSYNTVALAGLNELNFYHPNKRKFKHLFHNPYDSKTISDSFIRGIYKDQDSLLWIGTNNGDITILDKNLKILKTLKPRIGNNSKTTAFDFHRLDSSNMLMATSAGLLLRNEKNKRYKTIRVAGKSNRQTIRTRQIVEYSPNLLFVASNQGLIKLESDSLKASLLHNPNKETTDVNVKTIYLDPVDSNLWVGTNNSIEYFDVRLNRFTKSIAYVTEEQKNVDINFMVLSIQRTGNTLWVGTFNLGLLKINIVTNELNFITTNDGLPNNVVYSTLSDGENIWMGTNDGLSKMHIKTGRLSNFTYEDGVQGPEFNRLAFDQDDQHIFIGGTDGLNIIHTQQPPVVKKPEQLHINKVSIFNKFNDESNQNIKYLTSGSSKLNTQYDENYLKINFSSNNLQRSNSTPYYYQLEGFDGDWVKTTDNFVFYPNLSPGEYIFNVSNSINGADAAQLTIVIETPFWKTTLFYILFIATILSAISVVVYLKYKRDRQLKLFLKNEIDRRTHELNSSKNELESLNRKKDILFSILSHDLRSPLNSLKGFLDILIRSYGVMNEQEVKHHASKISDSINNSLDLIENTLNWSVSEMGNLKFNPSKINVNQLINQAIELYKLVAENKSIQIVKNYDEIFFVNADENTLLIVLRNLLSNAIKFTEPEKEVSITITEVDTTILISFKDAGSGVDPTILDDLHNIDANNVKRGTNNEKGTGLGLVLCSQFIQLNNGAIWVNPKYKKGAEFIISLPKYDESQPVTSSSIPDPKFSKVGAISLF